MINKYAEIQDRILLYNACKGILRVKQATIPWGSVAKALSTAGSAVKNYGGKAVNAAKAVNDKLAPVRDVASKVGAGANKAYNVVANPIRDFADWLGDEKTQNRINGLKAGMGFLGSAGQLFGQGQQMMGQMAQSDLEAKQRELQDMQIQAKMMQLQQQMAQMQQGQQPQQQPMQQQQMPQQQQQMPQQQVPQQQQVDPSMYQQQ